MVGPAQPVAAEIRPQSKEASVVGRARQLRERLPAIRTRLTGAALTSALVAERRPTRPPPDAEGPPLQVIRADRGRGRATERPP